MSGFAHGGDTYGLGDVIDFSASLNPLGMPMQVARALKEAVPEYTAYPDPFARDLTAALAERNEIEDAKIAVTAGATDALFRIVAAIAPKKALVCSPTYAGYEEALKPTWSRVVYHSLVAREDFDYNERILYYIEPDIDAVFLCSPNNPAGRTMPRELLCKVLRTAARWSTFVVLDESYLDFTEEHSATSLLDRYRNLIVVKSFTKAYAMAGIRLGWCACGAPDVAAKVRAVGMPWAVSTPALVAGMACLDVPGYLDLTREYVAEQRAALEAGLKDCGMFVVPSEANFVLFQSPRPLYDELLGRGILIRRCGNFRGLDDSWYRVGVRTAEDNRKLLDALKGRG